jgi:hypothetical protein
MILPIVLYLCEKWYIALMEGIQLQVFENSVLNEQFGR